MCALWLSTIYETTYCKHVLYVPLVPVDTRGVPCCTIAADPIGSVLLLGVLLCVLPVEVKDRQELLGRFLDRTCQLASPVVRRLSLLDCLREGVALLNLAVSVPNSIFLCGLMGQFINVI